tara:strand:- start:18 stop:755 length:738 start_codon:yes stop_codon:yes gene_type:complete
MILSLSLYAKGYKNYGSFKSTGEENFIDMISGEIRVCLDIGANIGNYSKLLINKTNAKIYAYEPLEKSFDELKKIKEKHKDRFFIEKLALGNEDGIKKISSANDKSEKASFEKNLDKLSFIDKDNLREFDVSIKKLDSLNFFDSHNKVDFLKIDVEGYEYEVLLGGKKFIDFNSPKFIQIEINWHQLFKKINLYEFSKLLKDYDIFKILPHGKNLIFIDPSRPENNIFHLSNFVFIRKDISKKYK